MSSSSISGIIITFIPIKLTLLITIFDFTDMNQSHSTCGILRGDVASSLNSHLDGILKESLQQRIDALKATLTEAEQALEFQKEETKTAVDQLHNFQGDFNKLKVEAACLPSQLTRTMRYNEKSHTAVRIATLPHYVNLLKEKVNRKRKEAVSLAEGSSSETDGSNSPHISGKKRKRGAKEALPKSRLNNFQIRCSMCSHMCQQYCLQCFLRVNLPIMKGICATCWEDHLELHPQSSKSVDVPNEGDLSDIE